RLREGAAGEQQEGQDGREAEAHGPIIWVSARRHVELHSRSSACEEDCLFHPPTVTIRPMARLRDVPSVLRKCGPIAFLKRLNREIADDNLFTWASALAYSWLFAIFPFF